LHHFPNEENDEYQPLFDDGYMPLSRQLSKRALSVISSKNDTSSSVLSSLESSPNAENYRKAPVSGFPAHAPTHPVAAFAPCPDEHDPMDESITSVTSAEDASILVDADDGVGNGTRRRAIQLCCDNLNQINQQRQIGGSFLAKMKGYADLANNWFSGAWLHELKPL